MEIKVRGVDPAAVKKIDELATKQDVSRNTFLVNMIQNFTALEEFKSFEDRYQSMVDKCLRVIYHNTDALQKIMEVVDDEE
ncbi:MULTISPECIES: hypothetical protein [Faecalispora]|uniref:hypothetical protein n=1 Tax=Faecalispora TaxID=3115229 RepID=UPI0024BA148A|nr:MULTISPECIES: hypothetical protein [Faecalispora]